MVVRDGVLNVFTTGFIQSFYRNLEFLDARMATVVKSKSTRNPQAQLLRNRNFHSHLFIAAVKFAH